MSEHSSELVWSQMVDEGQYEKAADFATGSIPTADSTEFTGIAEEHMKLVRDLSLALYAASEFLSNPDQPSSQAEALLVDIDHLQDVLSRTIGLEPHTVNRIAEITPQLESIALLRLG